MTERPAPLTVFIVDDDPSVRDSLALLLSLNGQATAAFAGAADFLAAAREDWAGCAIGDIRMPGMDGLELLAAMKERGIALPAVVVTAHGDVASARAAFKRDAPTASRERRRWAWNSACRPAGRCRRRSSTRPEEGPG